MLRAALVGSTSVRLMGEVTPPLIWNRAALVPETVVAKLDDPSGVERLELQKRTVWVVDGDELLNETDDPVTF